jgi:diaminohydroxyphosphoribosylaminopyrimidine deaminase/5-amino-6-(5-phosphoribosylamino)uracil reductase
MHRCLELALLGAGHTSPNPMVGAVLIYEGRVIGEGYHQQYGQAHAEVNCLASVREEDRPFIEQSTLYVSLEPCAHHGKTPPCANLIIEKKIPSVVVGCRDPFPQVNGKGIERLLAAGVKVDLGMLEKECIRLNKRFFTFHLLHRPYFLLKWAQSANGRISAGHDNRVSISNEYTNKLVHKWRSEEAAILVGTRTALWDDPALTVRLWNGPNPVRLVIDQELRLPESLRVFDRQVRTIIFNRLRHEEQENLLYYQLTEDGSLIHQLSVALFHLKIQSVLVEGGAALIQSFIDEEYWDEARVIVNRELQIPEGLASPVFKKSQFLYAETLFSDTISYYNNPATLF